MILTVQGKGTITISQELRRALGIQPGDPLDARVESGRLVLTPVAIVPRTLSLTDSGKAKEDEADADIRRGRYRVFDDLPDLMGDLNG